jgi:cysteine desulfurase
MQPRIYLDHHAATPTSARARAAMEAARAIGWANPSSVHHEGRASRAILEGARASIAAAIGVNAADVVLTSGGTEACNLAIHGMVRAGGSIVTTAIEHPAIAAPIAALEHRGSNVIRLPARGGRLPGASEIDVAIDAAIALRRSTVVVLQLVNHETGTILPVAEIGARCRDRCVPLIVDATQAVGKIPVDVGALGASAVAIASHKIGGPGGAGALWVARDAEIDPILLGGAQERGRRAGTPDVIAFAGLGAACGGIDERLGAMPAIAARRDRIERALIELGAARGIEIATNADEGMRVATVSSTSVRGWRGTALVAALDLEGVAVASGAACSSGLDAPSPVILAMHDDEPWRAKSALRISLGPETTDDELALALDALGRVLDRRPA